MGSIPSGVTVLDLHSTPTTDDHQIDYSQTQQVDKINQLFSESERAIKSQVSELFRESTSTIKEKLRENLLSVERTILFHVGSQLHNSENQIMDRLTELLSQSKSLLQLNVNLNSVEQSGSLSGLDLQRDEVSTKEIDQGDMSTTPQDKHKATFSRSEQVVLLTDELNETWRTIHDDVLRMMAVAKQKNVTAQLLHDTVDIDKKKYELLLRQKQPELYSYVTCGLMTSHDCVTALENMKECRREITHAEELIGDKYSALISAPSSVQSQARPPPIKPLVDLKTIVLPPTESRRNKVRERARMLIKERYVARRDGVGMHDDDQDPPARGLGVGRSNVSSGRGRRCALRPDPVALRPFSLGRGHGSVSSQPLPPSSSSAAWNQSIPAITWNHTAPHWVTSAPPSLTPIMTIRLPGTTTVDMSRPPPPPPSAFSPSTNWVPPMTSQNMLLPCQLPEPVEPGVAPDVESRTWAPGPPDTVGPDLESESEVDLIPVATSSTSDL